MGISGGLVPPYYVQEDWSFSLSRLFGSFWWDGNPKLCQFSVA